ncbi:hypothetical protein, partial [Enterobacter ludwigii]|uniref:hypothetical protein n=1 Tax=Enterobacter ludwigii TaxID=299767 RepID=UPI003D6DC325
TNCSSGLMRCLGDKRISDSRRGYFALGCCDRAYGGLKRRFGDENLALNPPQKPKLDEYHGKICAGQTESNPS